MQCTRRRGCGGTSRLISDSAAVAPLLLTLTMTMTPVLNARSEVFNAMVPSRLRRLAAAAKRATVRETLTYGSG